MNIKEKYEIQKVKIMNNQLSIIRVSNVSCSNVFNILHHIYCTTIMYMERKIFVGYCGNEKSKTRMYMEGIGFPDMLFIVLL